MIFSTKKNVALRFYDFFLSHLLKQIFRKSDLPFNTKTHNLLSLHVSPKITHVRDLCIKHTEISFFLKRDKTLVIRSCLYFRWLFWGSK